MSREDENRVDVSFVLPPMTERAEEILKLLNNSYYKVRTGDTFTCNFKGKTVTSPIVMFLGTFNIKKRNNEDELLKCMLSYDVSFKVKGEYYLQDAPKKVTEKHIIDENEVKNIIITSLIHSACATEHKWLLDSDEPNRNRGPIKIKELNDYYEGHSSFSLEDIDFVSLMTNQQLVAFVPPVFNSVFNSIKKYDYARMIEIIALCYMIKGLSKDLFLEKFKGALGNRAEKYWDNIAGRQEDPFMAAATDDAIRGLNLLYNKKQERWSNRIEEVKEQIVSIKDEIEDEYDKFYNKVVKPLLAKQVKLVDELRQEKGTYAEDLKSSVKQYKSELPLDVQKNVPIQGYVTLDRHYVNIDTSMDIEGDDECYTI